MIDWNRVKAAGGARGKRPRAGKGRILVPPRRVGDRGVTATLDSMPSREESFKLEGLLNSLKYTFERV
jgi:hypothetical protein